MFQFKLTRRANRPYRPESKEEYLAQQQELANRGRALEAVTRETGYKQAVEHFEAVINSKLRDQTESMIDLRHYIQGVEAVFAYFESGARTAEAAEANIEKYKDE